jgi:HAD superfamily hydrolase (TIGR01509 family)
MFEEIKLWIFDMDGTLTVPVHDFDKMRVELGVPDAEDILDYLAVQDSPKKEELYSKLHDIEVDYAKMGTAQTNADNLLSCLITMGRKVAVLTRNNKINTETTLEAAGLLKYFKSENIITRESSEPKPSPQAILDLLKRTGVSARETIMVGDYKHDIEAGAAAKVHTLYFDGADEGLWSGIADRTIKSYLEVFAELM